VAFSLAVCLVAACSLVAAAGEADPTLAPPQQPASRPGLLLFDLPVPGGGAALYGVAGLPAPSGPLSLLPLVRVLHGPTDAAAPLAKGAARNNTPKGADAIAAHLRAMAIVHNGSPARAGQASHDLVPLPLSPGVWLDVVFKNRVKADGLLEAILLDRPAALLYYGLLSLDQPTLEFFDAHRSLLSALYNLGVGAFATCGRSIHVRDGVVLLPGGATARPAWEALVGEPATDPERFVLALIAADGGRRAYLLDTVTHLDAPRQAFALGGPNTQGGADSLRSLYAAISNFEPTGGYNSSPFVRRSVDAAIILMAVHVSPGGHLAPPAGQEFWRAALGGKTDDCSSVGARPVGGEVEAPWLVGRLIKEEAGAPVLNQVLFAQRVFGSASGAALRDACEVVASYRRFSGLLATLEQMGFAEPRDYLQAVRFAEAIGTEADVRTAVRSLAQVQGTLALLERMAAVSPSESNEAKTLALSLFGLPVLRGRSARTQRTATQATAPVFPGRVGEWMKTVLVPRLCAEANSVDVCLEQAASGLRRLDRPKPIVEWLGERYEMDLAHAAGMRVAAVRKRQRPVTLDLALSVVSLGIELREQPFTENAAVQQAAALQDLASRLDSSAATPFDVNLGEVGSMLTRAARTLIGARRKPPTVAADVLEASDVLLASALASFAYAIAIGDIDSSFLLADDPARRHAFGVTVTAQSDLAPAWQLAREDWGGANGPWTVRGSLLGLTRACALSWSRRLSVAPIAVRPTLTPDELHGFAESISALNPFALSDAGGAAISAAIERGKSLLKEIPLEPDTFAARASAIGVSEWRVQTAIWLARHEASAVPQLLALVELLWLGTPDAAQIGEIDAWGLPADRLDGTLAVRMPRGHSFEDFAGRSATSMCSHVADLHLRVAAWLEQMHLPAALMPGIVSFATWDLTTTAQPADLVDYMAVIRAARAIPLERFGDYVSALTTDGTLSAISREPRPRAGLQGHTR
jgi:hypothetical protein